MEDINFALVEEIRPPVYKAMKYWGKKPHNIWREYIKTYTPKDGLYLDPFAGSAISAFEAVKAGRKAVAFDLNPLTSFIIETYCNKFDEQNFKNRVYDIINTIDKDKTYLEYFSTKCKTCKKDSIVQNFKWDGNKIYELGVQCLNCTLHTQEPTSSDIKRSKEMDNINIPYWYPKNLFHDSPSFSANFISCVGGKYFYNLWTKRNLYVISRMFDEIKKTKKSDLRSSLLLGFIKTLHLCTKMCVPRRSGANRPFSTSWGRSAYICASRQMEMNPLLLFKGSCIGRQSVKSALQSFKSYIGKEPKIFHVDKSNRSSQTKSFDIKYGIVNINTINQYIDDESVDFILTDPPYGGLVQYLDLSMIWLVWLQKLDPKYAPDLQSEITIKRGNIKDYSLKFQKAIKNLYKVLKNNGKIVFTFHNKDIKIWNAFLKAIRLANFKIEKVIHQQNRRTGESNVANPYGTSGADFYVRCIKNLDRTSGSIPDNEKEFTNKVVQTAIELIGQRNEPTPYQILFNGILAEISSSGFDIEDFDANVNKILKREVGKIFKITENKNNKAGKYWWFKEPSKYIKYPDRDLQDRLEHTISSLLRNQQSVSFDDVLGKIFTKYPNGLIPEVQSISNVLKKYAYKAGGMWHYKGCEVAKAFTDHTEMLVHLSTIGKKMNFEIYIGKTEQSHEYKTNMLINYADVKNLNDFHFIREKKKRIEMIDMLWIKGGEIKYAIEVENSTKFTSGLQRGSNLDKTINKIMVLPEIRKEEFLKIRDPMFVNTFKSQNWGYIFYQDIKKLKSSRKITQELLKKFLNRLS